MAPTQPNGPSEASCSNSGQSFFNILYWNPSLFTALGRLHVDIHTTGSRPCPPESGTTYAGSSLVAAPTARQSQSSSCGGDAVGARGLPEAQPSIAHYDGFIRHGSVIAVKRIQNAREFGEQVRRHRLHAGLSQEALARSTSVSRSTVIDLEQGRNVSISTALKVLSQLGAGLAIKEAPREPVLYWTAEMAAHEIKRELRSGDPDFAMRVLSMAASYFDNLSPADRRRFLRARPASTGRKRWDALLARTFAYKCHQHGLKEPDWTSTPPLESKWYATPRKHVSSAWKQRMAKRTPVEFAEANIVFDAANLAAA